MYRQSFYFPPLRETPGVMALILFNVAFFLFDFIGQAMHLGLSLSDVYAWPIAPTWVLTLHLWQPLTYPFVHMSGGFLALLADCLALYFFAGSLERAWGTTRFIIYFFLSAVLVGAVLTPISAVTNQEPVLSGLGPGMWLTMIVAFATLNPGATILLMFIIPLQARWLAWITIAVDIFAFYPYFGGPIAALLAVGVLSFFAYAFTSRDFRMGFRGRGGPKGPSLKERFDRWQQRRRMRQWQRRVSKIDRPEDLFKDK